MFSDYSTCYVCGKNNQSSKVKQSATKNLDFSLTSALFLSCDKLFSPLTISDLEKTTKYFFCSNCFQKQSGFHHSGVEQRWNHQTLSELDVQKQGLDKGLRLVLVWLAEDWACWKFCGITFRRNYTLVKGFSWSIPMVQPSGGAMDVGGVSSIGTSGRKGAAEWGKVERRI